MTLAHDIAAIRQALRPIPCDGPGGPDGYGIEDWEIEEWNATYREATGPAVITRLLAALDAAEGLREALKPFAAFEFGPNWAGHAIREREGDVNVMCGYDAAGQTTGIDVAMSDFDRARAALTTYRETTK